MSETNRNPASIEKEVRIFKQLKCYKFIKETNVDPEEFEEIVESIKARQKILF